MPKTGVKCGPRALSRFRKRNFDNGTKSKNTPSRCKGNGKKRTEIVHQKTIKVVMRLRIGIRYVSRKHLGKFRRRMKMIFVGRIVVCSSESRCAPNFPEWKSDISFVYSKRIIFVSFPLKMRQSVGCMCHKGDHRPSDLHSTALNFCPLPISRIEFSKLSKSDLF